MISLHKETRKIFVVDLPFDGQNKALNGRKATSRLFIGSNFQTHGALCKQCPKNQIFQTSF